MRIYLVRHTSVVWDGSVICYGNTDVKVRDTFEEEALITRDRLAGLQFDAVFTSPLSRAVCLCVYCGHPYATHDARLKEMNFGDWEGQLWKDIIINEPTDQFFDRYIYNPTPRGESQMMQYERVQEFILEKKAMGYGQILIFCHGGVINCVRAMAGEVKLNEAFATIPGFGSITAIDF